MKKNLVLTCEHATNFVPKKYRDIFDPERYVKGTWVEGKIKDIISQHYGYDIGALEVARFISKGTNIPLRAFPVCRLLIEGNRYLRKSFFSKLTNALPETEKDYLIYTYWRPHVEIIERDILRAINKNGHAVHLGIHSFTPNFRGTERNCDIGILFDPKYKTEKDFAHKLQDALKKQFPDFAIRRNYPYAGNSQGLPKFFHKKFSEKQYVGIELEINNKHLRTNGQNKKMICVTILSAIEMSLR